MEDVKEPLASWVPCASEVICLNLSFFISKVEMTPIPFYGIVRNLGNTMPIKDSNGTLPLLDNC